MKLKLTLSLTTLTLGLLAGIMPAQATSYAPPRTHEGLATLTAEFMLTNLEYQARVYENKHGKFPALGKLKVEGTERFRPYVFKNKQESCLAVGDMGTLTKAGKVTTARPTKFIVREQSWLQTYTGVPKTLTTDCERAIAGFYATTEGVTFKGEGPFTSEHTYADPPGLRVQPAGTTKVYRHGATAGKNSGLMSPKKGSLTVAKPTETTACTALRLDSWPKGLGQVTQWTYKNFIWQEESTAASLTANGACSQQALSGGPWANAPRLAVDFKSEVAAIYRDSKGKTLAEDMRDAAAWLSYYKENLGKDASYLALASFYRHQESTTLQAVGKQDGGLCAVAKTTGKGKRQWLIDSKGTVSFPVSSTKGKLWNDLRASGPCGLTYAAQLAKEAKHHGKAVVKPSYRNATQAKTKKAWRKAAQAHKLDHGLKVKGRAYCGYVQDPSTGQVTWALLKAAGKKPLVTHSKPASSLCTNLKPSAYGRQASL